MNTPKHFNTSDVRIFKCEIDNCPVCGHPIMLGSYTSGRKFIQTLDGTIRVGYRHGQCTNEECDLSMKKWRSSHATRS
jgi:hypothetical protein